MVDLNNIAKVAQETFKYATGAFYGHVGLRSLGVGLIYDGIRYAIFDEQEKLFDTVSGLVYVLTHECDIDADNQRAFNNYVLICPIINLETIVSEFAMIKSDDYIINITKDLVSDKIFRALYFPPYDSEQIPQGGVLYLNQIASTHVSAFGEAEARPICALSSYAQQIVDLKLQNHLFRPKAESLR